jgi:two-component sensor histidine kinase
MKKRKPAERLVRLARHGVRSRSPAAFGFAVLCVAAATLLRLAVDSIAPTAAPFTTYFPAILITTFVAGRTAGALATVLSVATAWALFVQPRFGFALDRAEAVGVLLFLAAALIMMWVADQYRRVLRRLDEEEHYRQVIVDELGHRMKNKLATIHAILRHELRTQDKIWGSVSGRLRALSAADDFLTDTEGTGIDLRQLVAMELQPYGEKRVRVRGGPLALHAKLSSVLALVVHELATNAAKYGALSTEGGCVDIAWREENGKIAIDWVESGGPAVIPPGKRSFGSSLIERSLVVLGGTADLQFPPSGVICRIRAPKEPPPETSENAVAWG